MSVAYRLHIVKKIDGDGQRSFLLVSKAYVQDSQRPSDLTHLIETYHARSLDRATGLTLRSRRYPPVFPPPSIRAQASSPPCSQCRARTAALKATATISSIARAATSRISSASMGSTMRLPPCLRPSFTSPSLTRSTFWPLSIVLDSKTSTPD